MLKYLKYIAFIILTSALIYIAYLFSQGQFLRKKHIITDSTVVLEKVNKVLKLVTVEANFSELHKHEEFYNIVSSGIKC